MVGRNASNAVVSTELTITITAPKPPIVVIAIVVVASRHHRRRRRRVAGCGLRVDELNGFPKWREQT